jgi:hypothetical protein
MKVRVEKKLAKKEKGVKGPLMYKIPKMTFVFS